MAPKSRTPKTIQNADQKRPFRSSQSINRWGDSNLAGVRTILIMHSKAVCLADHLDQWSNSAMESFVPATDQCGD